MSLGRWIVGGVAAAVAVVLLLFVVIIGGEGALQQVPASCGVTTVGGPPVAIQAGQTGHARTIIGVAKGRGVPQKGQLVALAVGLQESGLRNLANDGSDPRNHPADARIVRESLNLSHDGVGHDYNSINVFQQRPTIKGKPAWGTVAQLMQPPAAADRFFGALERVNDWQTLPVTVAGQRVQRSAYPNAYAKWESTAAQLAAANADAPPIAVQSAAPGAPTDPGSGFTGADGLCGPGGVLPVTGATGDAAAVIAQTQRWIGTPYSWGGGTLDGPGRGICCSPNGTDARSIVGFDCSSLVRFAFHHGAGINLPRVSSQQYAATAGRTVVRGDPDPAVLQPGDLLFWGRSAGSIHHVAVYVGGGKMIHAPRSGSSVHIRDVYDSDFYAATRPLAVSAPNQ